MVLRKHGFVGFSAFGEVKAGSVVHSFIRRLAHGFSNVLDWQTESGKVLLFGLDFLGMVFVDLFKEFHFFDLKVLKLFFFVLFFFCYFHDVLGLFKVKTANFLFPVLHVSFLGLL